MNFEMLYSEVAVAVHSVESGNIKKLEDSANCQKHLGSHQSKQVQKTLDATNSLDHHILLIYKLSNIHIRIVQSL